MKTPQRLSLADMSGFENPLNRQPDQYPGFGGVVVGALLNRVAVGLADHSGSWTTAPERCRPFDGSIRGLDGLISVYGVLFILRNDSHLPRFRG